MPSLVIEKTRLADRWVSLEVEGEVDLATTDQLEDAIDAIRSGSSDSLVVDLNPTSFMDSTGLKALVLADRAFRDDGRGFAIAVKSGPISRLIDLSGVDSSIRVVAKPDDVLDGP